jgi:5-methylcytosine-specific restriction enzyme subunit McrC
LTAKRQIQVFEHETIRFDKGEKKITEKQFIALAKYYGDKGVPFYSLIRNGVRFNEYVGVIQVGNFVINVLPKADKNPSPGEEEKWQKILIDMMRAVGSFDIKSTSDSNLKIKPNVLLDLYFEMFINEVEYLLNHGLAKQYRKKEGNVTALKGSLLFAKHIQQNLTHQERFFVRYTTFDVEHKLHFILYKTILLLKQINTSESLNSRIGALLLNFPEMPDIIVTEATFEKLAFNRKTQQYKKAIEIAKLLLLRYHPDLSKGRNHVLALMFDMNKLWEKFVYVSLHKNLDAETIIKGQSWKYFWSSVSGKSAKIIPDIWIKKGSENYVLDTKWKNLYGSNPSPDDLHQMNVYQKFYNAKKIALIYPGSENDNRLGHFLDTIDGKTKKEECSVIILSVKNNIKKWQEEIKDYVFNWIEENKVIN